METEDDSFQPTIDMLLNVSIFAFYGAICPWPLFAHNSVIPIYRLIFLGILVMLLRRLPMVLLFRKQIGHIEDLRQALFVGFFGPIGVSAIFYLYTSMDYLRSIQVDGQERPDAARLSEVMYVVVWFMAICSILVHGLTIPLGKLGFYLPRTISRAISSERISEEGEPEGLEMHEHTLARSPELEAGLSDRRRFTPSSPMRLFKIGGTTMKDDKDRSGSRGSNSKSKGVVEDSSGSGTQTPSPGMQSPRPMSVYAPQSPSISGRRAIRFPDQGRTIDQ